MIILLSVLIGFIILFTLALLLEDKCRGEIPSYDPAKRPPAPPRPKAPGSLNDIARMVHRLAVDKGWHSDDNETFIRNTVCNIHGEVSEFWEAYRKGELDKQCDKACQLTCGEEEMADILIRALDSCERLGYDVERIVTSKHEYNSTRAYRHGNKRA